MLASANEINSPASVTPLLFASFQIFNCEKAVSDLSILPSALLSKSANAAKPFAAFAPDFNAVLFPNNSLPFQ